MTGSIAILGGFASPSLIGLARDLTGGLSGGLAFMTALIVTGGLATLFALPEGVPRGRGPAGRRAPRGVARMG